MKEYFKNLNPLHLFLFATAFMLLARTIDNNFAFEISLMFASLVLYILALVRYLKK